MKKNLYIPYGVFTAPVNMAIDELLLDDCMKSGRAYARFYGWAEPSCTIGYFQRLDGQKAPSAPCVRRLTGGGTVLHDRDLTFSFCGLLKPPLACSSDIYGIFGRLVFEAMPPSMPRRKMKKIEGAAPKKKFYNCFDSPVSEDILYNGHKIYGGALRKTKNAFLFHGTIKSDFGSNEKKTTERRILRRLEKLLGPFEKTSLSQAVMKKAEYLAREKYSRAEWNTPGKKKAEKI